MSDKTTEIPLNVLDAACAAYMAVLEGQPLNEAALLWNHWRLRLAEKGDKAAIEALAEDRAAMSAALQVALRLFTFDEWHHAPACPANHFQPGRPHGT